MDDVLVSPMYAKLKLVRQAMNLRCETDKDPRLVQQCYKKTVTTASY